LFYKNTLFCHAKISLQAHWYAISQIFRAAQMRNRMGICATQYFFCTVPLKEKIKSRRRSAKCRFRSHAHQLFHLHKGADIFQEGGSAQRGRLLLFHAVLQAKRHSPRRAYAAHAESELLHKAQIKSTKF
jgi:hypothetical protein